MAEVQAVILPPDFVDAVAPGATAPVGAVILEGTPGAKGDKGDQGPTGIVAALVAGTDIDVDATDPTQPIISVPAGTFATAAQGALADSAVQPGDLGTAAAEDASAFDTAGAAANAVAAEAVTRSAADSALDARLVPLEADPTTAAALNAAISALASVYQPLDSDLTAIAALSTTAFGRSVLTQANAGALRTLAGLGTAAVADSTAFDLAGSAAAAQAASQPLDSDLTAIAALSTTAFGRAFLGFADAPAARTALGLGSAATQNTSAFDAAGSATTAQANAEAYTDAETARAEAVEAAKADLVGGVVPTSQLPMLTLLDKHAVADEAAMLALTGLNPGDVAVRADSDPPVWMLLATPASDVANWLQLGIGGGAVDSVNGQVGTVVLGYTDVGADASGAAAAAQAASQPLDATLTALAGLVVAANKLVYATGADAFATTDLTSFARTILDDADAATARATLGLGTAALAASGDFQAADAELAALAGLVSAANKLPYFTGSGTASLADLTSFARTLLDDADEATARATLGLGTAATHPATDFDASGAAAAAQAASQPLDATLTALAAVVTAADKLIYATASDTFSTTTLSAFIRTLLDDTDAATARGTLGLGSAATHPSTDFDASGAAAAAQAASQPLDTELTALAGLTSAADSVPVFTGSGTAGLVALAASQVLGRKASGATTALTAADLKTILALVSTDLSDFTESVQDVVGALVGAGSGIAVTYDDAGNAETISDGPLTINAQTGTSYTLELADAPKFVTMSNASASTLTVPPNSSVAFPVGTVIEGAQLGAGQVTLTPGSGVTINGTPGLKIAAQYGSFALIKTATDTWLAIGRLSA